MTSWLRKNSDLMIIVAVVVGSMIIGQLCSQWGMNWYGTALKLPAVTPTSAVFSIAWSVIYLLCGACAVILVRGYQHTYYYRRILALFIIIAVLNSMWSYLFFVHRAIFGALLDAIVLELALVLLVTLTWRDARTIALLLIPYACWEAFAIYLNYLIYLMN